MLEVAHPHDGSLMLSVRLISDDAALHHSQPVAAFCCDHIPNDIKLDTITTHTLTQIHRFESRSLPWPRGFASLRDAQADVTLLNVSYDPTRELYQDFNAAFAKHWQAKTGEKVTIKQSHGGSGKQARP